MSDEKSKLVIQIMNREIVINVSFMMHFFVTKYQMLSLIVIVRERHLSDYEEPTTTFSKGGSQSNMRMQLCIHAQTAACSFTLKTNF